MLPRILCLCALFIFTNAYNQSPVTDSLLNEMCNTLKETAHLQDSSRIQIMVEKHVSPWFEKMSLAQQEKAWLQIFFRLQRNCQEFFVLTIDKNTEKKGDWKLLNSKIKTKLTDRECLEFQKYQRFAYLESTGDTVKLVIRDGKWLEKFSDGTFSELKFRWLSACEFEIEFLKSNNTSRENLSRPGDKYKYEIIEQGDGYYLMLLKMPEFNHYSTFKLYYWKS